jgi:hypothetical protein
MAHRKGKLQSGSLLPSLEERLAAWRRRLGVAVVVDDGHDRSSCKISLPSVLLLVFFTGRYLDVDEPCLVRRTITVETRDLYRFGTP